MHSKLDNILIIMLIFVQPWDEDLSGDLFCFFISSVLLILNVDIVSF